MVRALPAASLQAPHLALAAEGGGTARLPGLETILSGVVLKWQNEWAVESRPRRPLLPAVLDAALMSVRAAAVFEREACRCKP